MDADGILLLMEDNELCFNPMDHHLTAMAFEEDEFINMSMEMGRSEMNDSLVLHFKVGVV